MAQSESEQKSNSLKWSFKRRRAQDLGIYLNWALLGYGLDEHKEWIIIEEEAAIVRTIFNLYLDGHSSAQIAAILTKNGIPTVKGLPTWRSGSVLVILRNEKYCGDALCQKTVTVDFFTHKSVKNNGLETQYFIEGHHIPIIDKQDWLLTQQIRAERRYAKRRSKQVKPRYVLKGHLAGYMIIDAEWSFDDVDCLFSRLLENTANYSTLAEDENFII